MLKPSVFRRCVKKTSAMSCGIPVDILGRLPLFTRRKYDWGLIYPLLTVLSGEQDKMEGRTASNGSVQEDEEADERCDRRLASDVFVYLAYVCEENGSTCQPVLTAGQLISHGTVWCTSMDVHAKHSSDLVRFLDVLCQPFAFELRRKLLFHCMNESTSEEIVLAPLYTECLSDPVPTSYAAMIGPSGREAAPRLVNDVGPESWPRAWKVHDGSKPFDSWPDHVSGQSLDLRKWEWEPDPVDVGKSVVEVAWNAFLFLVRSSEEQVDLRTFADRLEAGRKTEGVVSIYLTSKDGRAFACALQIDDLIALSVWSHESLATTASKKWVGEPELVDLLRDCLQRFLFPPLPKVGDDGKVEPW